MLASLDSLLAQETESSASPISEITIDHLHALGVVWICLFASKMALDIYLFTYILD